MRFPLLRGPTCCEERQKERFCNYFVIKWIKKLLPVNSLIYLIFNLFILFVAHLQFVYAWPFFCHLLLLFTFVWLLLWLAEWVRKKHFTWLGRPKRSSMSVPPKAPIDAYFHALANKTHSRIHTDTHTHGHTLLHCHVVDNSNDKCRVTNIVLVYVHFLWVFSPQLNLVVVCVRVCVCFYVCLYVDKTGPLVQLFDDWCTV